MAITNIFTDDWDNYTHDDVEESLKDILQSHELAMATIQGIVAQVQAQAITRETDPTVPAWAKQPTKPTYTAEEVGALPADTPVSGNIENSTTSTDTNKALSAAQGYVIRREMEKLLAALSNSAFSTARPVFDWSTPGVTQTYNITQTLSNCSSSNTDNTITEGSTFTTTLSASSGYTLDGVTPTITMNGIAVSGAWNATTKVVTIPNVSGDIVITATAVLVQQSYTIGYTLSHCTKSQDSATSVVEGASFNAVLIPDEGYTMNGVQATGTGFSQSYDSTNDRINISGSNVSGNISIGCTAATFQVSVSYNLTGFQSETNTQITSGGSFTKTLSPNTGYSVKTIAITMNGTDITATAWTAATRTINIPLVTGNIVITATAEETTTHTISFDLTGCTASGQTEVVDGDSTTITLAKGNDWSSTSSSGGSEYNVPFNKRDILVMRASDYVPLIEGTDYTISQSALDANIVISFSAVSSDILVMNIVWATKGIKISSGSETVLDHERYAHMATYIPVATNCTSLSIMTNIVTANLAGAALYDQNKLFTGGANADALKVIDLTWNASQQSSNAFVRSTVYSWYKQQKEEEGYYGTILPGEPISGNTFEKIAAWCYIYDKTNGRFIWKGENAATSYVFTHQTLGQE